MELPEQVTGSFDVFVNGVPQQEGVDYDRVGRMLVFRRELAEETKVWLAFWNATADPQVQRSELTITEASFAVSPAEARELWQALLERARLVDG